MSRFLCAASALLLSATLLMGAQAQTADTAPVARGLIVQLKTAPEGRESAQAQRERLTGIAADAGLASSEAPMAVTASRATRRRSAWSRSSKRWKARLA